MRELSQEEAIVWATEKNAGEHDGEILVAKSDTDEENFVELDTADPDEMESIRDGWFYSFQVWSQHAE